MTTTRRPRLLTIMGSGETAPTMKVPHRRVFERLEAGGDAVRAVMLDTPFGFQENAPILAAATTKYFADSIGRDVEVAGLGRMDTGDVVAIESGIARVRSADWVFAGPGSPTFALGQWRGTALPDVLADKIRPGGPGGALVFSSAAALTLGVATVPVYEIYKVGMDPWWEPGLDLLASVGIRAAVIPHFDNAEGGNHDTRFCYLGERRLAMLEPELPDDAFVLGIDEHTGVIMDLDADTAEVVGKGHLTLRRPDGGVVLVGSGETVPLDVLRSGGRDLTPTSTTATTSHPVEDSATSAATTSGSAPSAPATSGPVEGAAAQPAAEATGVPDSLEAATALHEAAFERALAAGDATGAVAAILDLDRAIAEWSADTLQSDQVDRARAALRSMVVRLGAAAEEGLRDPREVVGPVVEAALAARRIAREEKAYSVSDALRDGLDAAGIEVRDTADGAEWHLRTP